MTIDTICDETVEREKSESSTFVCVLFLYVRPLRAFNII